MRRKTNLIWNRGEEQTDRIGLHLFSFVCQFEKIRGEKRHFQKCEQIEKTEYETGKDEGERSQRRKKKDEENFLARHRS